MTATPLALLALPVRQVLAADTWTSAQLTTRFGLPALLIVVGAGLYLWGRSERQRARSQIGMKGGFGGPPGTHDIGTEAGFGVEGRGPRRNAGASKILAGLSAVTVGLLLMFAMVVWRLLS